MKRNINPPENKERSTQMKTRIRNSTHGLLLMSLLLVCFALLPRAQAFVTDPDETFPNFNTAAGLEALLFNTTGFSNTAYGARALRANTSGSSNLGLGGFALINNLDGISNTAVGNNAMFSNQHGDNNMALGQGALGSNVSGNSNVAMGSQALTANTGSNNTGVGFQALASNGSSSPNTAIGFHALFSAVDGVENTAVGFNALASNVHGDFMTAIGNQALENYTGSGQHNIGIGEESGASLISGDANIYVGAHVNGGSGFTTASESQTTRIGVATGGFQQTACLSAASSVGRCRLPRPPFVSSIPTESSAALSRRDVLSVTLNRWIRPVKCSLRLNRSLSTTRAMTRTHPVLA